jgi:hypothetical protein
VNRPLLSLNQQSSDSWHKLSLRFFHGGSIPLARHIERYTKSQLSHQSDALAAMQGIFKRYSKYDNPVLEYWGIPMASSAFIRGNNRPHSDFLHANAQAVFGFGLLWYPYGPEQAVQRRIGFPSWSWAGWNTPVGWPDWSDADFQSTLETFSISVVSGTNSEIPLTSEVIGRFKDEHSRGHTPALRIDGEVLSIKFSRTSSSKIGQSECPSIETFEILMFHVPDLQHANGCHWPLMLTTQAQEGSELWDALCNENFQCVVLEHRFALVVWREERIGVLELQQRYGSPHILETRDLRDMVQSEKSTVVVR